MRAAAESAQAISLRTLILKESRMVDPKAKPKAVFCTNVALPPNVHNFEAEGAEIDLIIDGVKTTITKTCFVHVPAGVKHGGLCFRKIDRPVFQIAMLRQDIFASVPPT